AGSLGLPISLEMVNSHGGAFHFPAQSWRFKKSTCAGGPLTMLGTHSFDTIEYLFGEAQSVFSIVKKVCAPTQAPDTSSCLVEMKNGCLCYLSNNYNVPSCAYLQLHGSEGSVYYPLDSEKIY